MVSAFTDKEWKAVLAALGEAIGPEADRYADDLQARLAAAIPYLSGSEDPDRFAFSNLLTLHGSRKAPSLFAYRSSDQDIFRRWATYHVGNQSEPRIVDFGLILLALGHLTQMEKLAANASESGAANPVRDGTWGPTLRGELQAELAKTPWLREEFEKAVPGLLSS